MIVTDIQACFVLGALFGNGRRIDCGQQFRASFHIRQTARSCGHISISEHFSKWIGLGLPLGKLVEAKLLLEAQNGSGTIAFSKATVVVK